MSESEKPPFLKTVEQIRAINAEIDGLLGIVGPFSESSIDALGHRLRERSDCLETLRNDTEGLEKTGDPEVSHQIVSFWNAFCKELQGQDEYRLLSIKHRMNDVADAIRLTRKRQLLLHYR